MDSASAINSASNIQMDYMKLLVTQLQNQNPLEPFGTERDYANSLIGKEISFASENETGGRDLTSGIVEEVINNVDGKIMLVTADHAVALEGVISVKN